MFKMGEAKTSMLVFFCNGQKISEQHPDPLMSLARYLRTKLQLTGCKIGCGVGGCGACTVMISSVEPRGKNIRHIAVNACIYPLCTMHGKAVTTVEGIGSTKTKLHAVQERLAKAHGSQCGFCSPGMVMSMYTLLRNNPKPTSEQILQAMEGNLCRCTGYRPILDAFNTFAEGGCCNGKAGQKCCKSDETEMCTDLFDATEFTEYDPTQDIIFPPELLTDRAPFNQTVQFTGGQITWISATSLEDLLRLKANNPSALILAGNTATGASNHQGVIIHAGQVPELSDVTITDSGLKVGAYVTMSQLKNAIGEQSKTLLSGKGTTFNLIYQTLQRYSSQQIRNVATVGGHIVSPGPGFDLVPIFLVVGAKISILKTDGSSRDVTFDADSYSSNGTIVKENEIVQYIEIPFSNENEYVDCYKMTRRRHYMDAAVVNAAFRMNFEPGSDVIKDGHLVFGGFRDIPIFATQTMKKLIGRTWSSSDMLESTCSSLKEELQPHFTTSDPLADEYCSGLVAASFFKFFSTVHRNRGDKQISTTALFSSNDAAPESKPLLRGTAVFQPVPDDQPDIDPIGRPIVHRSALQQTTGEAVYVDDLPPVQGELYLAYVLPSRGRAKVVSVDTKEALAVEGVVTYVCADDITGVNMSLMNDEEIMVTKEVYCVAQIIGAIVAKSPEIAHRAAQLVKVTFEDVPIITTIEDAIDQEAFHQPIRSLQKGNVDEGFKESPLVIEGTVRTAGQEHYYMEPHACIAIPAGEAGEMELRTCFQEVSIVQYSVAKALGVDANKINCRTKRVGGSFGGKANRCTYMVACAVAAQKTGKAVRMVLPRDVDMQITNNREASMAKYRVGFDNTGRVNVVDITVYVNWGMPADIHDAVIGQILFGIDNVYSTDHFRTTVKSCAANIPAGKPMRTFGVVQSVFIIESIVTDVAMKCGLPPVQVRELNMHKADAPSKYYGLPIDDFNVFTRCWKECLEKSDYHNRREQIIAHNSENRWSKRGLALVPVSFNIGGYPAFMHQAGAIVNAYIDGSILLHHGGVEVGQGLHTKMIQIASRVLGIPVDKVHVAENSSHVLPNATDTASSNSTDMWGMAIKNACETMGNRLAPYKSANPDGKFADWVNAAYMNRVNLTAIGYYKTPGLDWDWETQSGRPFPYATFGAACSEVQIDCLTGNHELLRTDIVMDVGKSLNPALDVGQIEGAFMMGYGYFALEELLWAKDGTLITNGPHNYKIPCARDIPTEFNVTLLRNCPNPRAVYSSKGIGEPPMCLASSVHFAIQDAIQSARADAGETGVISLDAPATADRIRKACGDAALKLTK